jgi:hypothetical protein
MGSSEVGQSVKHFLCLMGASLLAPTEWQITMSRRVAFPLFDQAVGVLQKKDLVVSTGPPYSVWREASWCQQNSKAWSLVSLMCVTVGSWYWIGTWGCLWGSKDRGLESSGAHKALGSTCVEAWASRSHCSCCWLRRTDSAESGHSRAWFPARIIYLYINSHAHYIFVIRTLKIYSQQLHMQCIVNCSH